MKLDKLPDWTEEKRNLVTGFHHSRDDDRRHFGDRDLKKYAGTTYTIHKRIVEY